MLFIETTLRALDIDTEWNAYSGLSIEENEDGFVKVYDDHASGVVNGKDFQQYLQDSETIQELHEDGNKDKLLEEIWGWVSANEI